MPRFNIAPTQSVAVVRQSGGKETRQLCLLRWGLIPAWAKDPSIGARLINARAETVAEKPAFRSAFKSRRCLIPADGYYEWKKTGSRKQPYYLRLQDERPFALAGLWDRWNGGGKDAPLETCTIITTEANEITCPIHDRMPAILAEDDYSAVARPGRARSSGARKAAATVRCQADVRDSGQHACQLCPQRRSPLHRRAAGAVRLKRPPARLCYNPSLFHSQRGRGTTDQKWNSATDASTLGSPG